MSIEVDRIEKNEDVVMYNNTTGCIYPTYDWEMVIEFCEKISVKKGEQAVREILCMDEVDCTLPEYFDETIETYLKNKEKEE